MWRPSRVSCDDTKQRMVNGHDVDEIASVYGIMFYRYVLSKITSAGSVMLWCLSLQIYYTVGSGTKPTYGTSVKIQKMVTNNAKDRPVD